MAYILHILLLVVFLIGESEAKTFTDWNERLLDDIETTKKLSRETLDSLDPETQAEEWAELAQKLLETIPDNRLSKEELDFFNGLMEQAQSQRILQEDIKKRLNLERIVHRLQLEQSAEYEYVSHLQKLLEKAQDPDLIHLKTLIHSDLMRYYFYIQGDADKSLEHLNAALDGLKKQNTGSAYFKFNLQQNAILILRLSRLNEKADKLFQTLAETCAVNKWRYSCSILHYNQATDLMDREDTEKLAEAEYHIKQAEYFGMDSNPVEAPYLAYLWLKYYIKAQKIDSALKSGRKALALFEERNTLDFLAFTNNKMAQALNQAGRNSEALVYAKNANELLRKDNYQGLLRQNTESLYRIYKALGMKAEAFEALEQHLSLWQAEQSSRSQASFYKKAGDIGLYVEEVKNKMLEEKLNHQRFVQQVTVALLIFTIVAVLLLLGAFRQYRQIQRLQQDAKRQADKDRQDEIFRLETKHRSSLASAVAHKINNPLNYLSFYCEDLKGNVTKLHQILDAIMQESDAEETSEVQLQIVSLMKNSLGTLEVMGQALTQTSKIVAEVRAISGVDGGKIAKVSIHELIKLTLERLQEITDPANFRRLCILTGAVSTDAHIESDFYILKHALEQLFLAILSKCSGQVTVEVKVADAHLLFDIELDQSLEDLFLEALEASLSNLLRTGALLPDYQVLGKRFVLRLRPIAESISGGAVKRAG